MFSNCLNWRRIRENFNGVKCKWVRILNESQQLKICKNFGVFKYPKIDRTGKGLDNKCRLITGKCLSFNHNQLVIHRTFSDF